MNYEALALAVKEGDQQAVTDLVSQGLAEGADAQAMLDNGLLKGMAELGELFKNNEVFVPEVLMAARALNKGTAMLKDNLAEGGGPQAIGRVVIATVSGDLHDIGKNLVKMMMECVGFEVIDLGVDVPVDKIIAAVREHKPDIVAMSALLTTTMAFQKTVVEALRDAGLRDNVKIMVGGAPVTQAFCDTIGADCYTADAPSAATAAKALLLKEAN